MTLRHRIRQFVAVISTIVLLSSASVSQTGQCATVIPGNPLPDLIVNQPRLKSDIHVTVEKFASTDCAVVEGCVTSKGTHQLLRFTSSVPNVGGGDLVIGDPLQCASLFEGATAITTKSLRILPITDCGPILVTRLGSLIAI